MAAGHVLVVVRDRELRAHCCDALSATGFRVTTSESEEGARYALEFLHPQPPDVLVFSIQEPLSDSLMDAVRRASSRPVLAVVEPLEDAHRRKRPGPVAVVKEALKQRGQRRTVMND